jgi:DNA-directed RNA polymerase subunit beta'
MLLRFKDNVGTSQFNAIRIGIASPEKIKMLSYGEVKKIETINYRTLKPEKDGLFCARIFGPVKDWECNCGKYKRMKHRGVTCEKCGVEVIQSRVRRERMGHIDLVAPVCHIWYLKGIPSYLGMILDMSVKDLERVVYFDCYMVIHQGRSPYARKMLLTNAEYEAYVDAHPDDMNFVAKSGAEALRDVLGLIDIDVEIRMLRDSYAQSTSITSRHKLMRRIKVMSDLRHANLNPKLMVLDVLPVLPPDLRPLVPLEGGRFASSDLNELYRRVLNRNIRLKRLIEIEAPSVIVKNEKRMLQESVDALIDNGRRGQPVRGSNKRPLKSLSEMLRGKQGRFRQNLLGKRVDYSGRSVIVVDPELKMHQCGLPKIMALELFKPFVLSELILREIASNLRVAKRMVENLMPEVWGVLEEVVKKHTVLLNRAPTLHRLGIQGFHPILVEGKAIKIHPLVCAAFNADFDGDQMSVHVPLSNKARAEVEELVLSTKNLLSPANGKPVPLPSKDMVLGLHYMTKIRMNAKGEGIVFANANEVVSAYQCGKLDLHAKIKLRLADHTIVDTSVGRVLLFTNLPEGSDFDLVNKVVNRSDVRRAVESVYYKFGEAETVLFLDRIKKLGFQYATYGGISFGMDDLITPLRKNDIIDKAEKEVLNIEKLYMDGTITNRERYNKVLGIWSRTTSDVAKEMMLDLDVQNQESFLNKNHQNVPFNPIFMMLESGARGSKDQIKQLVGMRGLMAKPSGEIMETPIKNNFKEGLSVFEYFTSTHGARKGQADTALKTANSGYLTRRLVDVAQDVVITSEDCNSMGYIELEDVKESGEIIYSVANRAFGRIAAADIKDEVTGKLLVKQGTLINRDEVSLIEHSVVTKINVRSVLSCQARRGVCAGCYGMDLARGKQVDVGATVGIVAAQSIGEPGTQLTMRTFHIGGTASVTEQSGIVSSRYNGVVKFTGLKILVGIDGQKINMSRKASLQILSKEGIVLQESDIEYGTILFVNDSAEVQNGTKLCEWDANNASILTEFSGTVKLMNLINNVTYQELFDEGTEKINRVILEAKTDKHQPIIRILDNAGTELANYYLPTGAYLQVTNGQKVNLGDALVKMPRAASKTKDITTGGLPRIAELFEARLPKDPAIMADIDGEVVIGGIHRGMKTISVVSGDQSYDYSVPRGKQLKVSDGDKVQAGELLTTGEPVLQDILRIKGPDSIQHYLVDQIQEIYRSHGIDTNDRHIEVIVRQMMRKVRIIESGDSDFLVGDRIDRLKFRQVNELIRAEGRRVAVAKPLMMGITMASLDTESMISAASFQETTRILTEAAISGQEDYLYGLKENIIIGKLIPAGTGIKSFQEKYIGKDLTHLEREAERLEKGFKGA